MAEQVGAAKARRPAVAAAPLLPAAEPPAKKVKTPSKQAPKKVAPEQVSAGPKKRGPGRPKKQQ